MTHQDILNGKLVRAGPEHLDVDLEVRVFHANRDLAKHSEAVWREMSARSMTARRNISKPAEKLLAVGQGVAFEAGC